MFRQLCYLGCTVGLGIALVLPALAFDENVPPNNQLPAAPSDPPGVAGVVAGLDMLQAASDKFTRANGLRLVRLMEEETARAKDDAIKRKERAAKIAEAKQNLIKVFLFSDELPDASDPLSTRVIGIQAVAKLLSTSNQQEAILRAQGFNANARQGVFKLLLEDPEWENESIAKSPNRTHVLPGSHPLSAHLSVALGLLPASLFED